MPRATTILPCPLLALACADPSGSNGGGPPAVAQRSTAAVPVGSSGRPRVVTIQGNDSTGRPVSRGGPTVTVQIVGTNPGTAIVTDQGNGTWTATDTPLRPGFDTLLIAMDGASFRIDNTLDSVYTVGDDAFTLRGDDSNLSVNAQRRYVVVHLLAP